MNVIRRRRDLKPENVILAPKPEPRSSKRRQVEEEFRAVGAKVWREDDQPRARRWGAA